MLPGTVARGRDQIRVAIVNSGGPAGHGTVQPGQALMCSSGFNRAGRGRAGLLRVGQIQIALGQFLHVDVLERDDPYILAKAPRPMTRTEITRRSGVRGYGRRGRPVSGIVWSREEFLALPWVEDYLPAGGLPGSEKDPRGQICERYGERIPADQGVIDMAADDTAVIALANAPRSYVQPDHLCTFTGLDDIREALHRLYDEGLVIPLSNGCVLGPSLILEKDDAG
jgi:hypothetical protein